MNLIGALFGLAVAGLAATVAFELRPLPGPVADGSGRPGQAAVAIATAGSDGATIRAARLATLLARPPFSQTRRPPDRTSAAPGARPSDLKLPRMTGILIDGSRRSALFVAPDGGKPISVAVGGTIGPFTVQSIEPQSVVVLGPEGRRMVRTSFDPNPPAPVAPLASAPQPPQQLPPQFPGISPPPGNGVSKFSPGPSGTGYGAPR